MPLNLFIYPALGIEPGMAIYGMWDSVLGTVLIAVGIGIGLLVLLIGALSSKARTVPTWTCGEVQDNEEMIVSGTHFYKTVSSMAGLKQLYKGQEKGYFDPYNQSAKLGMSLTGILKWLHNGVLPTYVTWVTVGLLIVLFVVCQIW